MRIYVIERKDGGVSIMRLLSGKIADEVRRAGIDAVSWKQIKSSDIPEDRYFRNAWKKDMGIDMIKARQVHMGKIREKRDEKLKSLDIETLRGIDNQDAKQKLRDIPQAFDLSIAQTPEELKALWPEELND